MLKGQYIRLFVKKTNTQQVIAMATDLQLHVSAQVENSSTKDDVSGLWDENEVTAISYDISSTALIPIDADAANTMADMLGNAGEVVDWQIATVKGANNRTADVVIASGQANVTQFQLNGQNRQNASYTTQLSGKGTMTIA